MAGLPWDDSWSCPSNVGKISTSTPMKGSGLMSDENDVTNTSRFFKRDKSGCLYVDTSTPPLQCVDDMMNNLFYDPNRPKYAEQQKVVKGFESRQRDSSSGSSLYVTAASHVSKVSSNLSTACKVDRSCQERTPSRAPLATIQESVLDATFSGFNNFLFKTPKHEKKPDMHCVDLDTTTSSSISTMEIIPSLWKTPKNVALSNSNRATVQETELDSTFSGFNNFLFKTPKQKETELDLPFLGIRTFLFKTPEPDEESDVPFTVLTATSSSKTAENVVTPNSVRSINPSEKLSSFKNLSEKTQKWISIAKSQNCKVPASSNSFDVGSVQLTDLDVYPHTLEYTSWAFESSILCETPKSVKRKRKSVVEKEDLCVETPSTKNFRLLMDAAQQLAVGISVENPPTTTNSPSQSCMPNNVLFPELSTPPGLSSNEPPIDEERHIYPAETHKDSASTTANTTITVMCDLEPKSPKQRKPARKSLGRRRSSRVSLSIPCGFEERGDGSKKTLRRSIRLSTGKLKASTSKTASDRNNSERLNTPVAKKRPAVSKLPVLAAKICAIDQVTTIHSRVPSTDNVPKRGSNAFGLSQVQGRKNNIPRNSIASSTNKTVSLNKTRNSVISTTNKTESRNKTRNSVISTANKTESRNKTKISVISTANKTESRNKTISNASITQVPCYPKANTPSKMQNLQRDTNRLGSRTSFAIQAKPPTHPTNVVSSKKLSVPNQPSVRGRNSMAISSLSTQPSRRLSSIPQKLPTARRTNTSRTAAASQPRNLSCASRPSSNQAAVNRHTGCTKRND